jgi:tetraacyldisaccharide 4'-kinase
MSAALDLLNPYAWAMRVRRAAYDRGVLNSGHPGVPVISIGNLTMGGSGKTPLVIDIARRLIERGKRVAIVSRGYRRTTEGFVLVQEGSHVLADVRKSGDEAQLIAIKLPQAIVIVDEDRLHGARQAKNLGAEVIVLDDGYQHMRLRRDVNVLVVDSSRHPGEVFPFGLLREPLSAASDADAIIYTNADRADGSIENALQPYLRPEITRAHSRTRIGELLPFGDAPRLGPGALSGVRVLAVSSIANPVRFYQLLREYGAEVVPHALRDHAAYSDRVIERVRRHAAASASRCIVTTEKDGVKSAAFFSQNWQGPPAYMLRIDVEFMDGRDAFYALIDSVSP